MIKELPANEKDFLRCINRTCWLRLVAEIVGTVHGSVGPRRLTALERADKPHSDTELFLLNG